MKKVFNLSVILAVLMAAFSFSSCSKDDDDATVSITLDNNGVFAYAASSEASAAVTGNVAADAEIKTITLFLINGTSENSMSTESKTLTEDAAGKASYDFRIKLANGSYKLTVTDKDGNVSSKTFTVAKTFTLSIGGSNSSVGSYISIVDEKVYKASEATENAAAIEIVFDGTKFKSAKESSNSSFTAVASATVTMKGNVCSFETSTGYTGTIVANGTLGDAAKTYAVTVSKIAK